MKHLLIVTLAAFTPAALAATQVQMSTVSTDGVGEAIGTVTFTDSEYGLLIEPDLSGLPPSPHGLHMHENASCEPAESDGEMTAAGAAGAHFDPEGTGTHRGPYDDSGHLGDLPVLVVDAEGNATTPALAPRLEESQLSGHAIIIHEGGDNYSDEPTLGGGGSRIACGAVE